MFALAALICFVLALFGVDPGWSLMLLGLCFIALHLMFGWPIPLPNWRR